MSSVHIEHGLECYDIAERVKTVKVNTYRYAFYIATACLTCMTLLATRYYVSTDNTSRNMPSWYSGTEQPPECRKICATADCVQTSYEVLSSVHLEADPCEDFYQYSCGNFLQTRYPLSGVLSSSLMDMEKEMNLLLRNLIGRIPGKRSQVASRETLMKVRHFYDHCMGENSTDMSVSIIRELLSDAGVEDWPFLPESWTFHSVSRDVFLSLFAAMNEYSVVTPTFFTPYSNSSTPSGSSIVREFVDAQLTIQPLFFDSSKYLSKGKFVDVLHSYVQLITKMFQLLEAEEEYSLKFALEILVLEQQLAFFFESFTNDLDPGNLTNEFDYRDSKWDLFLKHFLDLSSIPVEDHTDIMVVGADREKLETLKDIIDSTPDRILVNYVVIRFIINHLGEMDFFFRDAAFSNEQVFPVLMKLGSRWEYCVYRTKIAFEPLLAAVYKEWYFSDGLVTRVREIFALVLDATLSAVERMHWLEDDSREVLKRIIKSLHLLDVTFNKTDQWDDTYKELQLHSPSFLENAVTFSKFVVTSRVKSQLNGGGRLDEPPRRILEANAFSLEDSILVGFGMLRLPMLAIHRPLILDVVKIGSVLIHEMAHIIHWYTGMQTAHSTQHILQNFETCLVNQYSHYKRETGSGTSDSNLTLLDDFADNMAQEITYTAFSDLARRDDVRLPGLRSVTLPQLYFVLGAQIWCEISKIGAYDVLRRHDTHSPGRYRVQGTFSNSEDFARFYQCPVGSEMNPFEKCSLFN